MQLLPTLKYENSGWLSLLVDILIVHRDDKLDVQPQTDRIFNTYNITKSQQKIWKYNR